MILAIKMTAAIGEFVHWVGLPIHIKSKLNQKFVLDRTHENGRNVAIWTLDPGHKNLTFSVDSDGRIHMVDTPDWVLDAGSKDADGINIKTVQLSKNPNIANHNRVKWKLHSDGRIESLAYPGKMLDISASKMENGTPVLLYHDTGNNNQRWIPVLVDKYYDGTSFKNLYDAATKKSSLSLSEFSRAWNAPFIMELSIDGYDSCLEIPYESFRCPSNKYNLIFCILSIIFVVFASILIYDYIRRNRDTNVNVYMEDDYWDSPLE